MRLKSEVREFGGVFRAFFDHAHLPPVSDASIFGQMKGLMEIHNRGKFRAYTMCGSQVINVQMFSDQQKVPFWGGFGWFIGLNTPKWSQIFMKFATAMEGHILHDIYYGF